VERPTTQIKSAALVGLVVGVAALALARARAIELHTMPGALHGFPSMSDEAGHVMASGELAQELHGTELVARVRWRFRDGHRAEEEDTFTIRPELAQRTFSWRETKEGGAERRRFEVDLESGRASATVADGAHPLHEDVKLEVPRGRSFAGFGVALAASELPLDHEGATEEISVVAFTPRPRAVTLQIRRGKEESVRAEGRSIASDEFTLHPKLPFPVALFVHPKDAHLWFTHRPPRALVRAEQNLVTQDDPRVVIDVFPPAPPSSPSSDGRGSGD
jgi:hypothetical protein